MTGALTGASRTTEGLQHPFGGLWRQSVCGDFGLLVVGPLQDCEKLVEEGVVATLGRIERSLHAVIARNEGRTHRTHARHPLARRLRITREALLPITQPAIEVRARGKQRAPARWLAWVLCRLSEIAEGEREI